MSFRLRVPPLILVLAIMPLALGAAGCAFVDNRVELPYKPCVTGYQGAGELEIEKPGSSLPEKEGLEVVGYVRNGYGMHTADVLAINDVADWIVLALSKELEAAGYEVHAVFELSGRCPGLRITIGQVLADIKSHRLVANVEYTIKVIDQGQTHHTIHAKAEGTYMSFTSIAESYARSLEIALQASAKDVIPKIVMATGGGLR